MTPTEKLGEKCFLENIQRFSHPETRPEQYNLYTGLAAMSQVLETVLHELNTIGIRLNSLEQKLDILIRS